MRESSKRPAMAFVFFTRSDLELPEHDEDARARTCAASLRGRPDAPSQGQSEGLARALAAAGRARRRGAGSRDEADACEPLRRAAHMAAARVSRSGSRGGAAGSPYPTCSLLLRAIGARLVDLGVAWGLYLAAGRAGAVMALLYLLLADGIFQGQSLGKRIFGVKVVHLPTRIGARYRDSVLRNAPLGARRSARDDARAAGAACLRRRRGRDRRRGGLDASVRDPLGLRLGDVWAQTQVVDGKVVAGAAER